MTIAERIITINSLIIQMTTNEQEALIKALKREVLRAKAKRLDNLVVPNAISVKEIIDEVRKVRSERYV